MKLAWSFLLLALSLNSGSLALADEQAQIEAKLKVEDLYEAPMGIIFDENSYLAGESILNNFTNVIVVNKAAEGPMAQTARVYINRQLVLVTPVSTGREDVEIVGVFDSLLRSVFTKGSTNSHWRHTVRGFYPITRVMDENYTSGESKFHMPYAMFFNDHHGLALHQVPPDLGGGEAAGIAALGHRASSGCVRVNRDEVAFIHNAVVAADKGQIPAIDSRSGRQLVDQSGQPIFKYGWKSIVIVEEY